MDPTPAAGMRRIETPNATMTTIASPTQGPTEDLSVWRVRMDAGQRGPSHVADREQVWLVVEGRLQIEVDGDVAEVAAGDALVVAAGVERRILAPADAEALVCGRGDTEVTVPGEPGGRGTPPWMA